MGLTFWFRNCVEGLGLKVQASGFRFSGVLLDARVTSCGGILISSFPQEVLHYAKEHPHIPLAVAVLGVNHNKKQKTFGETRIVIQVHARMQPHPDSSTCCGRGFRFHSLEFPFIGIMEKENGNFYLGFMV